MITIQSTRYHFLFLFLLVPVVVLVGMSATGLQETDFSCSTLACMRSQVCSAGQTMALDTGPGAGTFTCTPHASAWRKPYFDDSGIQIASGTAGNHWKRDFAHTPDDPIQLNWYGWVADKAVIDTLINRFTHDFGDELYVQAPSSAVALDTLRWNSAWNFTGDVSTFMFLESDQAIDIVHGGSAVATMILLEDYDTVKIGGPNLNLRLIGKHPGADCAYPLSPGTKCSEAAGDLTFSSSDTTDALLAFRQNSPAGRLLDIRINALDCNDTCIVHRGMSHGLENRTAKAVLRGTYVNGSVRYTGGIRDLDADLTVEDPHARGQGWLGTPYPDNNSCASGELGSDEKSTGFWFQHMESIVGRYEMRYGGVRWFSAGDEHIGASESERFVIVMDSLGFTGPSSAAPGTQVSTNGCEMQGGKADGWPDYNDGAITRFMEVSEEPGSTTIGYRSFVLEATGVPITCCADVMLSGLTGESVIGVMDPGEIVSNIVIRGGPAPNRERLDLRGQNITVIGGTWNSDIRIASDSNDVGPITLQDLKIGGRIRVADTPAGTITLDGVVFSDTARQVIPDLKGTFEVPATGKVTAPAGSRIEGTGTLVCSGNTQSLPFTFDGEEDDCEAPVDPTSAEQPPQHEPPLEVLAVYPNPFSTTAILRYRVRVPGPVQVEVFDVLGRPVLRYEEQPRLAGENETVIDGSRLGAGMYYVRFAAPFGGQDAPVVVLVKV